MTDSIPFSNGSEADAPQTMVYTVDLGDGRIAEVEGPPNATPDQLHAIVSGGQAPAAPELVGAPDQAQQTDATPLSSEDETALRGLYHTGTADQIQAFLHARGRMSDPATVADYIAKRDAGKPVADNPNYAGQAVDPSNDWRAFARGGAQGLLLGHADETHGFLNGVVSMLSGNGYTKGYNDTVNRDRALDGSDREHNFGLSLAGNLVGGALLPMGLAKAGLTPTMEAVALRAGQEAVAAGATADAAKVIAARAVARRMAAEGAAYGGGYGEGSAEGGPSERLKGGVIGGLEGAAGGALLGGLGVRSAQKAAVPVAPTQGQETLAAMDRLGITPFAPDVAGPTTRRITAAVAQTPGGAKQIIDAAGRVTGEAQTARDAIAGAVGAALNPSEAGETALAGAKQYIARTSAQGNAMYRAAETAANGTRVAPTEALATLDQHIADLSQTPGGADGLDRLQGLRDALATGDHTVQGIRNMRTAIRDQFANDGLRGSDIERRANQVVDAANQDVVNGLNAAGNGNAATLYANADKFWRERLNTIDNTLAPIIGKKGDRSGEQVFAALQSNLKGNGARLDKFVSSLPSQEQQDVRASIIGRLGVASSGAQNAEGNAFSLPTFLNHWNNISESSKARLFGVETRSALNDLATVAQGAKEAQRYANHSNTGGVIGMLATGASGALGLKTLGLSIALPYAGGKLLANPTFARWLARAPKTALSNASYMERLGRIARSEPAIASEVLGFQRRLNDALASSSNRAAADETGNEISGTQRDAGNQQAPAESAQP